ncbi:MAG: hypothetical protein U1E12_10255 [Hydrogenophaga sp.]|uniref:hypothetical protein n=1 Tax=Hydrogenophaga sp. TaxID=1904254 RepID=UPI002ABBE65D|nr:hypothetical protein [Hydrogenophaga sp.]MDZ4102044.1 hypothetical protein [Hydrogenophaga sp.]
MDPKAIPAALRDFAAAAATSPDAAKSVADLALLIAELFDQAVAAVEAEAKDDTRFAFTTEPDDLAFPALDPVVDVSEGRTIPYSELRTLAMNGAGMLREHFDSLPEEEISLWVSVALAKLRQEQPADQAAA